MRRSLPSDMVRLNINGAPPGRAPVLARKVAPALDERVAVTGRATWVIIFRLLALAIPMQRL
jgi:hypothetical protein